MLVGWVVFLRALWLRRQVIAGRLRPVPLAAGAFVLGLGAGLLTASVATDFAYWWLGGAALLAVVQLLIAYLARN